MNFQPFTPLLEVAGDLSRGAITSEALTAQLLRRIDRLDPLLNVYLTVLADTAMACARASDERRARGECRSVLDGIALALKDNIDVAGVVTSNGLAGGPVATTSAPVVRRLEAAGAVLLGKVNLHECALGATTDNPHRGRTGNPWAPDHTPGGSSGGSAAAVAAGLCVAAVGTDTLGSVRLPAAYCGLAALKPTFGLVSTAGVSPLSFRLDHVGPMAPRVADLGPLLAAMAGFEAEDPTSRSHLDEGGYVPSRPMSLTGRRFGVIGNFDAVPERDGIAAAFANVCVRLEALGATMVRLELPRFDARSARRAALLLIEAHASADMDRVRTAEHGAFSETVEKMFAYGAALPGVRLARAERTVFEAAAALNHALAGVDAILSPTTTQAAFPFSQPAPEEQAELTTPANLAGIPALTLPMGCSPGGLPLGLQVMTPAFTDRRTLALGAALESLLGFSARPKLP